MPDGPAVREVLPALRAALAGTGPALLPGAAGSDPAVLGQLGSAEDTTAVVVETSGSTGLAKQVMLSAEALRASANATHARLGGQGHWLLAMPAHHIAGIQVLIRALLANTEPGVLALAGGFRAQAFADAAERVLREPGRHYTALVPTQLVRLLDEGGAGLAALSRFDAVLLGGAATPSSLRARAEQHGVPVVTTYGMSETAGGCVYDQHPLAGVRIEVDSTTPDGSGAITIAGPMLAHGYRGEPEQTAQAFASGRFHTGDLGRLLPDGRLEVLGRADDMIVTGGVNVPPVLVERALAGVPGVREVCVLGVPNREWGAAVGAAVVPTGSEPDLEELRGAVREQVGKAAVPKQFVFVPELPLRGPGKPDREILRNLFTPSA